MSQVTANDDKGRFRLIKRFCDICNDTSRPIEESITESNILILRYPIGGGTTWDHRGRTGRMWDLHPECVMELISRIGSEGREMSSAPMRAHDRSPSPAKHVSAPAPAQVKREVYPHPSNKPFVPHYKSPTPPRASTSTSTDVRPAVEPAGPLKPPINPHPIPDPPFGYRCADGGCGSCDYCRERT